MSSPRTWIRKDGNVCVREYKSIKGEDWKHYKQRKDCEYRERQRRNRLEGKGNNTTPPVQPKPRQPRNLPSKLECLPQEQVAQMKRLSSIGLDFVKIGNHFGVSRYLAELAVKGSFFAHVLPASKLDI